MSFNFSDVNALVDTVIECTEKIIIHGQVFSKTLLSKGEVKKLMYLLSSMKLVKNKILFYKMQFGKTVEKDYFEADLGTIHKRRLLIENKPGVRCGLCNLS